MILQVAPCFRVRVVCPRMFDMFDSRMEIRVPDELRAATQDLNLIKSLLPSLNMTDDFAMDVDREEFQLEDQESNQGGNDLLKQQGKQIAELKAIVGMLTTLILRQEVQLNISKQDTSYVVFINTKEPQSLAHTLHGVGVQWHKLKQEAPDQITSPMRIVMFQHFIEVVQTRFLRMLESPSSKSKPIELGFMQEKDGKIPGLRWDPAKGQHILDSQIEALSPEEVKGNLSRLLVLCAKDRVVARFHGMRKLSEEYTSPTLGMFLEVGLRTQEAQEFWNLLHRLSQSAVWMVAGCYLRHERLHLSALAKRLAAVSR